MALKTRKKPLTKKQQKKQVEKKLRQGTTWRERATIQNSLPFIQIYDDGIVELGNNRYSMTFSFSDINYTSSDDVRRIDTFQKYGEFLGSFDEKVSLQITLQNKPLWEYHRDLLLPITQQDKEKVVDVLVQEKIKDTHTNEKRTAKVLKKTTMAQLKQEYNEIQNNRIYGSHNYITERYLTLTIEAENYEKAKQWFERTKNKSLQDLKKVGSKVVQLQKIDKLKQLREFYRKHQKRSLNYPYIASLGVSDKDVIAPYEYDTTSDRYIRFGHDFVSQTLFVSELPSELSDNIVSEIMEVDQPITMTINLQPQAYKKAIKEVEKKLTHQEEQEYNERDRQVKQGNVNPQPSRKLKKSIKATEEFLDDIEKRNEKMFLANILVHVPGETTDNIDSIVEEIQNKVADCDIIPMSIQQEDAFNSCIPLGRNDLEIKRTLTTSSVAVFMPYNVAEITDRNGLVYGKNSMSNNIITFFRKLLFNGNGFILGIPGSGKSMGSKWEIWECFWRYPYDDIIIIDPEGEYDYLVKALGGQIIDIYTGSDIHINPFDINENYGGDNEPDPIPFKSNFIVSLIEVTLNKKDGIDPISRSVIDRCVREVYKPYINEAIDANIPTFVDFYELLKQQPDVEAKYIASALEVYIEGSLNIFSHRTNINLENRLVSFNTKRLGKQLRTMGMTVIQDYIWNRVSRNQAQNKSTWLYNDEIHLSLKNEETCNWLVESWKRGRKYGLLATGITQEIEDCFRIDTAKSLIAASEFVMMYKQAQTGLEILEKQMQLTPYQLSELLAVDQGVGFMKAGTDIIPFDNHFNSEEQYLYQLMSTKPGA